MTASSAGVSATATPEATAGREQKHLAQARLAAIVTSSADAVISETLDGIITDWNPAAERLFGLTAAEAIGQPGTVLIPPDRARERAALHDRVRRGDHVEPFDTVRRTRDGRLIDVSMTLSPVRDDTGEIVAIAAIVRDVSARKSAEAALADNESRLRALIDQVPVVIYTAHFHNVESVTSISPYVEQLLGFPPEAFLADRELWRSRIHPADRELVQRATARMNETGEPFSIAHRMIAADGRVIWVHDVSSLVRDAGGRPWFCQGVVQDITARKLAEEALAASETRFRTAFAGAPIGMALVAPDGRMLQVNRASCDMLGYAEAELLAMSFREITHPEDVEGNLAHIRAALAGEIDAYEMEKRYLRKDGQILWARLSVSLVRDDDDTPLYFISQIQDITDRKETEAEQAATHQRTREVLERITDGFCALDRDWRFTYINAAAERMGDCPRDDLIGKNLWEEFAPARDTPIFTACHQAMALGVTTSVVFLYPPTDRWLEAHIYPSPDGVSIFFRDVTESRRLTEELHASEAKFRRLVEQLPAAVYVLAADDAQTPLYFSPYYKTMTGIRIEQALARSGHWLANVHPKDRARVAAEEARSTMFGLPFLFEYRYLRGDGSAVWVRDVCVPVRDDAGEIVAWQGVLLDITDRIEAEAAQARLAAIVQSAEDAVIGSTLEGMITSWNQGAERLYGYTASEMIGRPFTVLLVDEQDQALQFPPAETGEQVVQFEATRRRRDGTLIDVAVTRSPIFDRTGTLVGVSTITRDITARKRAEDALRVALRDAEAGIRAKTLFLAMMSHELRTPLQAILGYADLLLGGPPDSLTPEQSEDLGAIHRGATRMVTLIEQMLDLSRMEAGRLELAAEAVDLSDIIAEVRQEVTPQAVAKGLALRVDLPPSLPPARGDALRIHQILLNLSGNAVKFTESGSVVISARAGGDEIAIAVRDTGIGIGAETLPFIFDEFNQVNGSTARRYGGTGLGLAIVRGLAEQMGGRIEVESQPGAGSTFTLWLPAASATPEVAASSGC